MGKFSLHRSGLGNKDAAPAKKNGLTQGTHWALAAKQAFFAIWTKGSTPVGSMFVTDVADFHTDCLISARFVVNLPLSQNDK